jgi:hypothetical protein
VQLKGCRKIVYGTDIYTGRRGNTVHIFYEVLNNCVACIFFVDIIVMYLVVELEILEYVFEGLQVQNPGLKQYSHNGRKFAKARREFTNRNKYPASTSEFR